MMRPYAGTTWSAPMLVEMKIGVTRLEMPPSRAVVDAAPCGPRPMPPTSDDDPNATGAVVQGAPRTVTLTGPSCATLPSLPTTR